MKFSVKEMVLGAVMLALAMVLSFVKVYQLPYGGSITLLSMLPIVFFALKSGFLKGLTVSFLYGCMQLLFSTESPFSWGLNFKTLALCILFDYILAFGVLGLVGIFKGKKISVQIAGVAVVMLLRFTSHFISGVTIFKNFEKFSFFGEKFVNPTLYSAVYNGSYMLPEMVFTCVAAFIFLKLTIFNRLLSTEPVSKKS